MKFDELEKAISIVDAHNKRNALGWKRRTKGNPPEWFTYWTPEKQSEVLGAEEICANYKTVKGLFKSYKRLEKDIQKLKLCEVSE